MQDFPTLPVPKWQVGKPVALEELKSVTDAYIKSMEPIRKLKVPEMPAQVQTSLKELARQMGNEKAVMELQVRHDSCQGCGQSVLYVNH